MVLDSFEAVVDDGDEGWMRPFVGAGVFEDLREDGCCFVGGGVGGRGVGDDEDGGLEEGHDG